MIQIPSIISYCGLAVVYGMYWILEYNGKGAIKDFLAREAADVKPVLFLYRIVLIK